MIGTIRYMSPERLAGAGYGVAADVWSLGVVLIEMAARRLPFESAVSQIELHDRLEASAIPLAVGSCCAWFVLRWQIGVHALGVSTSFFDGGFCAMFRFSATSWLALERHPCRFIFECSNRILDSTSLKTL